MVVDCTVQGVDIGMANTAVQAMACVSGMICPVARYLYADCPVLTVTYQVSCSDRR